ncbi:MAG: Uma2 family endonuclease [Planctomycetes bacterium]|nr:Uma2 family endonuclease [Planctomycetota bacterium]
MPLTQPYSPHTPSTMRTSRGEVRLPERMAVAEFEQLEWLPEDHWELIEGVPCMTPSGTPEHQRISLVLAAFLMEELESSGYLVLQDCDIRFPSEESYLRPDIAVFNGESLPADGVVPKTQLPTLVVELLSPSTAPNDLGPKLSVYDRAGVTEYWIVDPRTGGLMLHARPDQGMFKQVSADANGKVFSALLNRGIRIIRDGLAFRIAD